MNHLYWVRHGESEVNLTKEFSHRLVDRPLTPKGILQAQQTAEYFDGARITAIYCSPLKRAVETAQVIGKHLNLPVTPLEFFREIDDGDLEKQPPSPENWTLFLGVLDSWKRGDIYTSFPRGEDYVTLLARMKAGFRYLVDCHQDARILVVGHGGSFSATIQDWCTDIDKAKGLSVENCSITEVEMKILDGEVQGKLISWAKYDHLHGQAAQVVSGFPDGFKNSDILNVGKDK